MPSFYIVNLSKSAWSQVYLSIGLVLCGDNSVLDWTIGLIGLELNAVFSLSTGHSTDIHLFIGNCWRCSRTSVEKLNTGMTIKSSILLLLNLRMIWAFSSSSQSPQYGLPVSKSSHQQWFNQTHYDENISCVLFACVGFMRNTYTIITSQWTLSIEIWGTLSNITLSLINLESS